MVKWSNSEKSHNVCTPHIFTSFIYSHKTELMHTTFPVTTSLAYFCFHICPGRKFTYSLYSIEKMQINISSVGSSLFILLLSANTRPSVLLRRWWKTQMCSDACLCGAEVSPYCISYIIYIANRFLAMNSIDISDPKRLLFVWVIKYLIHH